MILPLIVDPDSRHQFLPAIPALARSLARVSMVRRARAARTRCRDAKGRASRREVVAGPGSHRASRGGHPDPDQLRQRGVYVARAHRSRPSRGAGQGGRFRVSRVAARVRLRRATGIGGATRRHRVKWRPLSSHQLRRCRCHEKSLCRRHRSASRTAARWHDGRRWRIRALRHSGKPDQGPGRQRHQGPHHRRQQRRRGRFRHGTAAEDAAGEEGHRQLRRREQGIRAPGAGRRAGAAADAARHARGKAARRRRRHPRLLHAHRLRHHAGRGQGHAQIRRQGLRAGGGHPRRRRHREGVEGRQVGQSRLPDDGAQFQSDDRHLRQGHGGGGRGAGGGRANSIRIRSTRRASTSTASSRARTTKSGSSSAPSPAPPRRRRIRRSAS